MEFGEFIEQGPGSGVGGEDAADGGEREGAEADGAVEGGADVVPRVLRSQGEQVLGLQLALDLLGEQAVEERGRHRAEFGEALPQQPRSFLGIVRRMVALDQLPHAGPRGRHEGVAGDLIQSDRVEDDFAVGDADRQNLADERPRHRVVVQPVREEAFDIHVAIDDERGVEVAGRQRQQMRPFAFVAVAGRLLEVAHRMHIGNGRQPLGRDFVEVVERVEGAAVEQADLGIVEFSLDFSLRLGASHAAGLGSEAVVGGEGEELRVVQRPFGVVPDDHRLEVVVEARPGHAAEVMEGVHVLAQRRRQVHRLDEAEVLPPGVAEQVAEEIDAAPAFAGEVDVVNAMIHLGLIARPGLEARHGRRRGSRPQPLDPFADDRVMSGEAAGPEFLKGAFPRQVRIAAEQFFQDRLERVDDADAPLRRRTFGRRSGSIGFDPGQDAIDGPA